MLIFWSVPGWTPSDFEFKSWTVFPAKASDLFPPSYGVYTLNWGLKQFIKTGLFLYNHTCTISMIFNSLTRLVSLTMV
jgi:hypothetical protein